MKGIVGEPDEDVELNLEPSLPPRRRSHGGVVPADKWEALERLKTNPGVWYRVATIANIDGNANRKSESWCSWLRRQGCTASRRIVDDDGTRGVWARYRGGDPQ